MKKHIKIRRRFEQQANKRSGLPPRLYFCAVRIAYFFGDAMTIKQALLLQKISDLGRHLTEEEIIQFYAENVQKNTCRMIMTRVGLKTFEPKWWELRGKAMAFYTYSIGRIFIQNNVVPVFK